MLRRALCCIGTQTIASVGRYIDGKHEEGAELSDLLC